MYFLNIWTKPATQHPQTSQIKFTTEMQENNTIPFLDTMMIDILPPTWSNHEDNHI